MSVLCLFYVCYICSISVLWLFYICTMTANYKIIVETGNLEAPVFKPSINISLGKLSFIFVISNITVFGLTRAIRLVTFPLPLPILTSNGFLVTAKCGTILGIIEVPVGNLRFRVKIKDLICDPLIRPASWLIIENIPTRLIVSKGTFDTLPLCLFILSIYFRFTLSLLFLYTTPVLLYPPRSYYTPSC